VWLALFLAASTTVAHAQRSLSWRALEVKARLDADGRLYVVERHAMVFTGDWNGGERSFRVLPGQHLSLGAVRRIDPSSGNARTLVSGSLDEADRYALVNGTTLRWRSRLPSDPPFADTEIDYEIAYSLSGVLLNRGGTYVLDHNFALPDADKTIESLSVDIDLDPVWIAPAGFLLHRTALHLPAGSNFVVHAELTRADGGAPSAVRTGTTAGACLFVFFLLLGGVVLIVFLFVRRESSVGRFGSYLDPASIDRAWLDEKVFSLLPEEAGALWDDSVGPSEVAAVLARLAAEKKLETTASGKELTMRLKAARGSFSTYEQALIEALFFSKRTETSTSAIKSHYKSSGLDPASKIRPGLLERLSTHEDFQDRRTRPSRLPTSLLLVAGGTLLAWNVLLGNIDLGTLVGLAISTALFWIPGAIGAKLYQKRVDGLVGWRLWFLYAPAFFLGWALRGVFTGGTSPLSVLLGQVLIQLAIVNNLFNIAQAREGPKKITRRQELSAARRFFVRELSTPSPRVEDAWFPWLVAFGLGPSVDRWFRAFGRASAAGQSSLSPSSSSSSSSPSSGWSPGGGGFTGGGLSGGAGATGSWAVAAGALAAGVSAPSSSSSGGGGGGGGGSSGGGGGGGW
jgi:hypothetical protein